MTTHPSPIFALTLGDPAGIGPEIAIKALTSKKLGAGFRVVIIGDLWVVKAAAKKLRCNVAVNAVTDVGEADKNGINVLDMKQLTPGSFSIGKVQAACGKAAYAYIIKAIDLAMAASVAGIITNPINKESLKMAGIDYPGHTEILADRTGTKEFSMLFYLDGVGVAHVTTHCSLKRAIGLVTAKRVLSQIKLLNAP
jgi:4-hydroxy-L-threonine phosphate dehydrogenase PdxA